MEKKSGKPLTDKEKSEITQQALELIRNRIDKFGVAEPSIRPKGNEAIEVQLPGVKDPQAVKRAFGMTGRVEYRLVDDNYSKIVSEWMQKNYKEPKLPETTKEQAELQDKITKEVKLPNKLEVMYSCSVI